MLESEPAVAFEQTCNGIIFNRKRYIEQGARHGARPFGLDHQCGLPRRVPEHEAVTVMLTAEEAIKMVPRKMREAAYGMGCTRTQVVLRVLVPTAFPGILTGVMLAVARAAGKCNVRRA